MVRIHSMYSRPVPTHQTDSTLNQAAPVQNTWYTILSTKYNAKLYSVSVQVATTGETLECKLTIDGVEYTGTVAAAANTDYVFHIDAWNTTGLAAALISSARGIIYPSGTYLIGRSILVQVRKTTAAGAGNLKGRAIYATY